MPNGMCTASITNETAATVNLFFLSFSFFCASCLININFKHDTLEKAIG